MRRVGFALIGALAILMPASGSLAADLLPPPVFVPPPIEVGHKWYLRGHIGMSNQYFDQLEYPGFSTPLFFEWLDEGNFDAGGIYGVGFGFRHNERLRFDFTAELRGKTHFSALDRYDDDSNPPDFGAGVATAWGINDYTAKKSELLFLANAYFDIPTKWEKITPYVGAGIGVSYNTISDFRDNNTIQGGGGYAGTGHKWNFAWALHAGTSWKITDKVTADFGYSFTWLGDAQTGILYNYDPVIGCGSVCQPVKFNDIYSHDFKLGLRYELGGGYRHKEPMYDFAPPPPVVKY